MVTRQADERSLIAGTIRDIEGSIERLEADRQDIEVELSEKKRRLSQWRARLADMDRESGAVPQRARRRKGENREIIATLLAANPAHGMTVTRIAEETGLPWSSVRSTFSRHTQTFVEIEGVWFLREPPAANGHASETTSQE